VTLALSEIDEVLEEPQRRAYYVYGVVAKTPDMSGLKGVQEAGVHALPAGDLAAVVSLIDLDRPPRSRSDLLAHSAVLDTLARSGPVIPVQFGSVLSDQESVENDLLRTREELFRGLLTELEGRTQFVMRASYREEVVLREVVAGDQRIADLRMRTRSLPEAASYADRVRLGELVSRAVDERRASDAEGLLAEVLPLTVASSPRAGSGMDHVINIALLVDNDRVSALEETLEDLAGVAHERMTIRLLGPMAPYDFVGDPGGLVD
jgi:Gas vesicle synthesis protein GvpL/GvpF